MTRASRRALAIIAVLASVIVATLVTSLVLSPTEAAPGVDIGIVTPSRDTSLDGLGEEDGLIETGGYISPFDDHLPAIAELDPALRDAMQAAATDAMADGFEFVVTSGWRSERYQRALFDQAVRDYGSEKEARRHVATAEGSEHITGDAVDIGFTDANSWLSQHGADYGLCQIYANEMWHFELATTPGGECPPQLPDPSYR